MLGLPSILSLFRKEFKNIIIQEKVRFYLSYDFKIFLFLCKDVNVFSNALRLISLVLFVINMRRCYGHYFITLHVPENLKPLVV